METASRGQGREAGSFPCGEDTDDGRAGRSAGVWRHAIGCGAKGAYCKITLKLPRGFGLVKIGIDEPCFLLRGYLQLDHVSPTRNGIRKGAGYRMLL